jgi:hypothetical protein
MIWKDRVFFKMHSRRQFLATLGWAALVAECLICGCRVEVRITQRAYAKEAPK